MSFDGQMLIVELPGTVVGAPAHGAVAWTSIYEMRLPAMASLPKRLMTDPVEVGIWDERLEIERWSCEIAKVRARPRGASRSFSSDE